MLVGVVGVVGCFEEVVGDVALRADLDQLAADCEDVTRFSVDGGDFARDRRRHLDGRLVGEHLGDCGLGGDLVADLDEPLDEFRLGDTLTDVGELHVVDAHGASSSFIAVPTRSGPGKYDHSCACG